MKNAFLAAARHAARLLPLAALAVLIAHGGAGAADAAADDRAAVLEVIDQYIDGGRKGSGDVMRKAFLDGAVIHTANAGGPIQLLYDLVDSKPPAGAIPYAVTNLDVAGTVAMARVDIDDWAGAKYTDMFTLVKTGGEWKMASKVSHTR